MACGDFNCVSASLCGRCGTRDRCGTSGMHTGIRGTGVPGTVHACLSLHVQPEVPAGTIGVKIGDMTASEDDYIILVWRCTPTPAHPHPPPHTTPELRVWVVNPVTEMETWKQWAARRVLQPGRSAQMVAKLSIGLPKCECSERQTFQLFLPHMPHPFLRSHSHAFPEEYTICPVCPTRVVLGHSNPLDVRDGTSTCLRPDCCGTGSLGLCAFFFETQRSTPQYASNI